MIFLLHIPKTGGQTLATRLAAAFPAERVSVLEADVADAGVLARMAARYDFFAGHPGAAVLSPRPPGLSVMAMVRDPVAHAVSHWRHMRRDPQHPLHQAARALPPAAFAERFGHHMFDFQARTLVTAFRFPMPQDRVRGIELWLARHLEEALAGLRWVAPNEALDEFAALWALETGRAQNSPDLRINVAGAAGEEGAEPVAALRRWLQANPDRYAIDSLLWAEARRRFGAWRHRLLTRGADGTAAPPPGLAAWSAGEAGIWLMRDWHPPTRRGDGVTEWWVGPGLFPLVRLRRGAARRLRFEAPAFLGVRWDRVRLLRRPDLAELPLERSVDEATRIVAFEAGIEHLSGDEELVLYAPEDVTVLPALPLAWENPRRGFATQGWRLE